MRAVAVVEREVRARDGARDGRGKLLRGDCPPGLPFDGGDELMVCCVDFAVAVFVFFDQSIDVPVRFC